MCLERSEVEGPPHVLAAQEQVPPLRPSGSGRDDGAEVTTIPRRLQRLEILDQVVALAVSQGATDNSWRQLLDVGLHPFERMTGTAVAELARIELRQAGGAGRHVDLQSDGGWIELA